MNTCMRFLRIIHGQVILCNSKNRLTTNYFIDPNNPEKQEISILCQIHRDEILRAILRPYMIKVNEIEVEKSNMKKKTKRSAQYEIVFDPQIRDRIDTLYKEKNKISFDSCRDLLCNGEGEHHLSLDYNSVFSLLSYGIGGKLAHCFYFHKTCWDRTKRIFGLRDYKSNNQSLESFLTC